MTWIVVATLRCGCELHALSPKKGGSYVYPIGPCVYHLCRLCGAVPLADSEPDRLCESCFAQQQAKS